MLQVRHLHRAHTSPRATIEFNTHAHCALVGTVRHQTNLARDNRRTDVPHLGYKSVDVAWQNLRNSTRILTSVSVGIIS